MAKKKTKLSDEEIRKGVKAVIDQDLAKECSICEGRGVVSWKDGKTMFCVCQTEQLLDADNRHGVTMVDPTQDDFLSGQGPYMVITQPKGGG